MGENMAAKKQSVVEGEVVGSSNNVGMAVLSYLGILILIPFLMKAQNDPFVKFHMKQGIVLIVVDIVAMFVPFLGIVSLIFAIIGIMNAINKKQEELPLIGQFSQHVTFL